MKIDISGSGSTALTFFQVFLGADVTLSNTAYTDILSQSLTSGTWEITAEIQLTNANQNDNVFGKIWDGTTVGASAQTLVDGSTTNATGLFRRKVIVGISSTATWKVSLQSVAVTTSVAKAKIPSDATLGNNASSMIFVKIG